MKLLLTSAGITNNSIAQALRDLLGKPTNESKIVVVPTAHNPVSGDKTWVIEEDMAGPHKLGWKEFSIIDLAAVSTLDRKMWWTKFEDADVLLFGGGNNFYLSYWLQKSGLFDVLPKWPESKIFVGISAGSIVAGISMRYESHLLEKSGVLEDDDYDEVGPAGQSSNKTLNLMNFAIRPHLNSPNFPKVREPILEKRVAETGIPMYAVDDQTALKVIDNDVEVISEGTWKLFSH